MDLSSPRPPLEVRITALPSCEMATSLYVFLNMELEDNMAVGKEWFDAVRVALSPDLRAELEAYGLGLPKGWMFLWPWQGESTAEATCERFLARVSGASPASLRLALLGRHERPDRSSAEYELICRAATGDASALERCIQVVGDCPEEMSLEALRTRLMVDPEEDKQRLIRTLTGWYEQVFRQREAEITEILKRDAEMKRRLALRQAPLRQIELVTKGLQYEPEPGITRVVLIPSIACRPWVLIGIYDETKIFTYAVAEESLSESAQSSTTELLTILKALADERRLAALQLLAGRGLTLQELADALGVGKSLMHHHMVTLRAAGLVRIQLGGDRRYQLREDTVTMLPDLLRTWLAHGTDSPPSPSAP